MANPSRLRNIDMTDRELLHAINDVLLPDGTAIAQDVAERLKIRTNGKRTPAGTVSARFSWMRRNELIERIDARSYGGKASDPPRWVITQKGEAIMKGRLTKAVDSAIEKMGPGDQLLMMRRLSIRAYVESDQWMATAIRREWLHNAAHRAR